MSPRERALAIVAGGLAALQSERDHINDLNVYPVPDGDTGTNLSLTVQSVVDELERPDPGALPVVAADIARAALMGARGNSGVILSQMVRGACDAIAAAAAFDRLAVREALNEAAAAAYRAVKQPVEGTMLTVIREMAEATAATPVSASPEDLAKVALQAGKESVERTPDLLEALRRAGVVDAGGYGLLVLVRGIVETAFGGGKVPVPRVRTVRDDDAGHRHVPGIPDDGDDESEFRYCTSFLLTGEGLDRDDLERFVAGQGDSWLVVGDESMLKVHVHTDHPGTVLGYASANGAVGAVEVNDMREQTRERTRRLAQLREGSAAVAVVAGAGNAELFRELGCAEIIDGGQSMNPSAAQLVEAIAAAEAAEVVVLPNNKNIVLTAEQAAAMSERPVCVVPSASIPAGLSAMVAFDPLKTAAQNLVAMSGVVQAMHTAELTFAVRDSEIDGVGVRKGDVLGLIDGRMEASGDDLRTVFADVLRYFAAEGAEVVTVLTALNGYKVSIDELHVIAAEACPDAEVEFREGGQPLYPILVGAE